VSNKLFNYLEKGITYGSHTVPALSFTHHRKVHTVFCIFTIMFPVVLSEINTPISKHKINILGQYLKTNEAIGYVVLDVDKGLSKKCFGAVA